MPPRRSARAEGDPAEPKNSQLEACQWEPKETRKFLKELGNQNVLGTISDSGTTTDTVMLAVLEKIRKYNTRGPVKTTKMGQAKWVQLRRIGRVINKIKKQRSGWTWTAKGGACIDANGLGAQWGAWLNTLPKSEKPIAARFRNKGWEYEDLVFQIMPTHVTGDFGYHPSSQISPGVGSDAQPPVSQVEDAASSPEAAPELPLAGSPRWDIESNAGDDPEGTSAAPLAPLSISQARDDVQPATPASPRPSVWRVPSPQPIVYSEPPVTQSTPSVPVPSTPLPRPTPLASSKRMSGPNALHGINLSIDRFGDKIADAMQRATPKAGQNYPPGIDRTPTRKIKAIEMVMETEEDWLPEKRMTDLIRILQTDVSSADTYMTFIRKDKDSLRRTWIRGLLDIPDVLDPALF